jgi:hypothetical protein
MPDYFWSDFSENNLWERFPDWALGREAWQAFGREIPAALPQLLAALVQRRRVAMWGSPPLACPRLFVSHRQVDEKRAMEIVTLAKNVGFQVWVDVLDPVLKMASGHSPTSRDEAKSLAAIIETALLNSTHVLAVMTPHTQGSRWVPYEYGRARDSSPYSLKAGCWIDAQIQDLDLPEYLWLGVTTRSDTEITQWLTNELAIWQSRYSTCPQPTDNPTSSHDTPLTDSQPDRDAAERALDVFHAGLPFDLTVMKPAKLVKRTAPPTDS